MQLVHLAGGSRNSAADNPAPPLPDGMECQSLTVLHRIEDGGVPVPLMQADHLHGAIIGMSDVLFHSLARQIEAGIGDLDRREKVRTILARTFWGMNTERRGDVRVVVYADRNSPTVTFSMEQQWSVKQRLELVWQGRNGVELSAVASQTTVRVAPAERAGCAAWFTNQRIRLENHFAKRLAPAAGAGRTRA